MTAIRHGRIEDIYALAVGSLLIGLGLTILHSAGLVTGGMAGLALLVGHFAPLPPGLLFAALNLPFLFLALRAMGSLFTLRTVVASGGIALASVLSEHALTIEVKDPFAAAVGAGTLLGMGTLAVVRHGAGVGGVGIVTVWLQQRRGWNIGRSQILIDFAILAASSIFLPLDKLAWSATSAIGMGVVTALWLRPGRYAGFSPLRKVRPVEAVAAGNCAVRLKNS
ncbi:MAG: YitT family protein [Novosphingobium sp.]|jgi:uncharacterized membrane-anchored protein YitT (DUF2179 family)|nr:YitT family protein [Novosphingobium sp.]